MLAKKFRLPINTFPVKAKTRYKGQYLTIKAAPNSFPYNRVGVVITKKTAPKAVERNRIRREFFDAFQEVVREDGRRLRQDFGEPKRDLLVLIRPIRLNKIEEEDLMRELNAAIHKIK
ncbi:MAG: ribonuclease P protein component [Candidatus Colwellbacteria bacterium]|nr:ribonuclease P protein component [Candidatus Colwellbacteria bacterium]MBI3088899.1 ribonuclease P protein component [Candidatus Colwellbacteria bacterium]